MTKINCLRSPALAFLSIGVCCLQPFVSLSQSTPDSILLQQAIAVNRQLYVTEMGDNLRFYNGPRYLNSTQRAKDSPFWLSDSLLTGSIVYDGNFYDNMPMQYDLVNQDIVINSYRDKVQVILIPQKIQSFSIRQHHFIKLDATTDHHGGISAGFYDQLVGGTVSAWAKRTKRFELPAKADEQVGSFKQTDVYYIQSDSSFYPVESQRDVLKVLNNKADKINSFIKSNQLNLRKDFEASLIKIVNFYNQ